MRSAIHVPVIVRHEQLVSPEQTIMKYLEKHDTIKNKQAREITFISIAIK